MQAHLQKREECSAQEQDLDLLFPLSFQDDFVDKGRVRVVVPWQLHVGMSNLLQTN